MIVEKTYDTEKYTIASLMDALRRRQIRVNRDYQRASVWSRRKKQYLIDSILRGIPIGHLRFDLRGNIKWIVDGQQRIEAISDFYENKLPLSEKYSKDIIDEITIKLQETGREIKTNKKGQAIIKFEDLPIEFQDKFRNYKVDAELLRGYTDEEIREIFRRSQEGKKLTLGELLNAFPGSIVEVMRDIAEKIQLEDIIRSRNLRGKYYELIGKFMCLENGLMVHKINRIGAPDIKDFFNENMHINTNSDLAKRVRRVLRYMRNTFADSGIRIEPAHTFIMYFFFSFLLDNYVMKDQENNIREFYKELQAELEDEEKRRKDPELLQFHEYCVKSRNNSLYFKERLEFLLNRFFSKYELVEKDKQRKFNEKQKRTIYQLYNGKCAICGKRLGFYNSDAEYHHKVPYARGGKTSIENGMLVCKKCHIKLHIEEKFNFDKEVSI